MAVQDRSQQDEKYRIIDLPILGCTIVFSGLQHCVYIMQTMVRRQTCHSFLKSVQRKKCNCDCL